MMDYNNSKEVVHKMISPVHTKQKIREWNSKKKLAERSKKMREKEAEVSSVMGLNDWTPRKQLPPTTTNFSKQHPSLSLQRAGTPKQSDSLPDIGTDDQAALKTIDKATKAKRQRRQARRTAHQDPVVDEFYLGLVTAAQTAAAAAPGGGTPRGGHSRSAAGTMAGSTSLPELGTGAADWAAAGAGRARRRRRRRAPPPMPKGKLNSPRWLLKQRQRELNKKMKAMEEAMAAAAAAEPAVPLLPDIHVRPQDTFVGGDDDIGPSPDDPADPGGLGAPKDTAALAGGQKKEQGAGTAVGTEAGAAEAAASAKGARGLRSLRQQRARHRRVKEEEKAAAAASAGGAVGPGGQRQRRKSMLEAAGNDSRAELMRPDGRDGWDYGAGGPQLQGDALGAARQISQLVADPQHRELLRKKFKQPIGDGDSLKIKNKLHFEDAQRVLGEMGVRIAKSTLQNLLSPDERKENKNERVIGFQDLLNRAESCLYVNKHSDNKLLRLADRGVRPRRRGRAVGAGPSAKHAPDQIVVDGYPSGGGGPASGFPLGSGGSFPGGGKGPAGFPVGAAGGGGAAGPGECDAWSSYWHAKVVDRPGWRARPLGGHRRGRGPSGAPPAEGGGGDGAGAEGGRRPVLASLLC